MTKILKKQFKPIDRVKTQTAFWAAEQFQCTTAYVYGVVRGDFKGGRADEIKKAYDKKYAEIKKVLA